MWKTNALIVICLSVGLGAASQDRWGFASSLVKDTDYFRAVTVFKELEYFAKNDQERDRARIGQGLAYILMGKSELALAPLSATAEKEEAGRFLMGLCYIAERNFSQGEAVWGHTEFSNPEFEMGARIFRALYMLSLDRTVSAREYLASVSSGTSWDPLCLRAKLSADSLDVRPRYNALISGSASFLLPGLGQCLNGHWVDGLQAAVFVGAFGFLTYGTYLYDSKYSKDYVYTGIAASITVTFHLSNVIGAAKTAAYANQAAKDRILSNLEKDIWEHLTSVILT
jgi:hypothetical protein